MDLTQAEAVMDLIHAQSTLALRAANEQLGGVIGRAAAAEPGRAPEALPSISVNLSALHPRYEIAKRERVLAELGPRLLALAEQAPADTLDMMVQDYHARCVQGSARYVHEVTRLKSLTR
jgi:proline dehydrogenase